MRHAFYAASSQVTASPAASAGVLRRKCACGGTPGPTGECAECRKKRLQRQAREHGPVPAAPPVVHEVLGSPGQPLDAAPRAVMEGRFGHDFSRVRIHTGARAAASAEAVDARAYTVGRSIVFGRGQFAPDTQSGQQLLAHELTHVVQQGPVPAGGPLVVGPSGDADEREADAVADRVARGGGRAPSVGGRTAPTALQRQPKPTAPTTGSPGKPSCTPRTGFTEYGCYCGAGTSCGSGLTCAPTDDLDACCQAHDAAYGTCSFSDRYNPFSRCYSITRAADAVLCSCARGLAGRFHGDTESYRKNVMRLFC